MSSFAGAHRCPARGAARVPPLMDLRDGPEEAAFRAALRTWLEANVPSGLRGFRGWSGPAAVALGRDWSKRLAQAGYAGLTWPKEYGGGGRPGGHPGVFPPGVARGGGPPPPGVIGPGAAGPTFLASGRSEHDARHPGEGPLAQGS